MANPAFSRNAAFSEKGGVAVATPTAEELAAHYNQPSANAVETDRMTVEDTIVKSAISFVILLAGAAIGWMTYPTLPWLWGVAALVGFVLALVNIFKREPSAPLILAYAAAQGVFIGGISLLFESLYPGIVVQAVVATLVVVGVTLALFASGKVRATPKMTKIFLVAIVAYGVFSLVNLGLMLFNAPIAGGAFGIRSTVEIFGIPLGVPLGILVVLLAAYSLVLDFDGIQRGVRNGAPRKYSWTAAFGLMVTIVWLYLEILRLLAIVMGRR